jgi:stage V sporulation protein SpoVS
VPFGYNRRGGGLHLSVRKNWGVEHVATQSLRASRLAVEGEFEIQNIGRGEIGQKKKTVDIVNYWIPSRGATSLMAPLFRYHTMMAHIPHLPFVGPISSSLSEDVEGSDKFQFYVLCQV